jgi:hypothetical protein
MRGGDNATVGERIDRLASRGGTHDTLLELPMHAIGSPPLRLVSRSLAAAVTMAGLAVLAVGCGDRLPTVPVIGSVQVDGKPVAGVQVVLHPVDAAGPRLAKLRPTGRTEADGSYRIGTYEMADGAPAAEYRVTAEWFTGGPATTTSTTADPEANAAATQTDRFGGRFANPETSAVRVSIGRLSSSIPALELSTRPSKPPG